MSPPACFLLGFSVYSILPTFNTSNGLASGTYDMSGSYTGMRYVEDTNLAGVGTLSMEFTTLAHHTGEQQRKPLGFERFSQLAVLCKVHHIYASTVYANMPISYIGVH